MSLWILLFRIRLESDGTPKWIKEHFKYSINVMKVTEVMEALIRVQCLHLKGEGAEAQRSAGTACGHTVGDPSKTNFW